MPNKKPPRARKVKLPPRDAPLREVWDGLTDEQRDAIVAEQVAAAASGEAPPPDPEEEARHARVMKRLRSRGRPRVGQGAAKFNLSMERSLLKRLDSYAKRNRTTRAAVVARGVEHILAGPR